MAGSSFGLGGGSVGCCTELDCLARAHWLLTVCLQSPWGNVKG